MKSTKTIQLKAAFLLIVFSLNTLTGFACSVGMDLGFNTTHLQEEETVAGESKHVHADNKISHHESKASGHENKHAGDNCKSKEDADNCCNDKVTKFSQLDKVIPQPLTANSNLFTVLLFSFYNIDVLASSQLTRRIKYFVRTHHPPIPDILIANQRFQI